MKKSKIAYVCAAAVLLAAAVFSGCENAAGGSDAGGGSPIEGLPEVDTDPAAEAKLTGSWYGEGQTEPEPDLILEEDGTGIRYEAPMTWTASEDELQITQTYDFTEGQAWPFEKSGSSLILYMNGEGENGTEFTDKGNNTWSGTMYGSPVTLTMTDTTFTLDMTDGKSGQMATGTVDNDQLIANRIISINTYSYMLSADGNKLTLVSSFNGTEYTDTYTRQSQA